MSDELQLFDAMDEDGFSVSLRSDRDATPWIVAIVWVVFLVFVATIALPREPPLGDGSCIAGGYHPGRSASFDAFEWMIFPVQGPQEGDWPTTCIRSDAIPAARDLAAFYSLQLHDPRVAGADPNADVEWVEERPRNEVTWFRQSWGWGYEVRWALAQYHRWRSQRSEDQARAELAAAPDLRPPPLDQLYTDDELRYTHNRMMSAISTVQYLNKQLEDHEAHVAEVDAQRHAATRVNQVLVGLKWLGFLLLGALTVRIGRRGDRIVEVRRRGSSLEVGGRRLHLEEGWRAEPAYWGVELSREGERIPIRMGVDRDKARVLADAINVGVPELERDPEAEKRLEDLLNRAGSD